MQEMQHFAVNYERILKDGLRGYEKRVKEYKATLDLQIQIILSSIVL